MALVLARDPSHASALMVDTALGPSDVLEVHLSDDAPCPCGDGKPAGSCCLRTGPVRKRDGSLATERRLEVAHADPHPPKPETEKRVAGCYAADLDDCDGPVSDEHFISHWMLKLLVGHGGRLIVRGIDPENPEVVGWASSRTLLKFEGGGSTGPRSKDRGA